MRVSTMNLLAAATSVAILSACSGESLRGTRTGDTAASRSASNSGTSTRSSKIASGVSTLPAGTKLVAGATVPNTDFVFRRVLTGRGEMLWLDSVTQGTRSGAATRSMRAELKLPPLAADERLKLGSCDVGGRLDPFVVAIVVNETGVSRLAKIRQAWRAEPHVGRFTIIPIAGIVCE